MRHLKRNAKLGRKGSHRNQMLASLVRSLIKHKRITTTLAKAKAAAPVAEKMVTLAKRGTLHDRRLATARLKFQTKSAYNHKSKAHREAYRKYDDVVRILFDEIGPKYNDRTGGYTRIIKLPFRRRGDAGEQAILTWVEEGASTPKAKTVVAAPAEKTAPAAEAEEAVEVEASVEESTTTEAPEEKKDA